MNDYDDQRAKVAAAALRVFHEYGQERALDMYYGAIDALNYAILCIHPRPEIKLATDNTKAVELPCDVGPNAA